MNINRLKIRTVNISTKYAFNDILFDCDCSCGL